jgi:hypothetical protein
VETADEAWEEEVADAECEEEECAEVRAEIETASIVKDSEATVELGLIDDERRVAVIDCVELGCRLLDV